MVNDRHSRRPASVEEEERPASEYRGGKHGADESMKATAPFGGERVDRVHEGRVHFAVEERGRNGPKCSKSGVHARKSKRNEEAAQCAVGH